MVPHEGFEPSHLVFETSTTTDYVNGAIYGVSCWILTSVGILSTSDLQTATFVLSVNDTYSCLKL